MSEHTPEPWTVEGPDDFGDYNILHGGDALAIGAVVSNMRPPTITAANARRIPACVNACAGIGTEVLERFGAEFQEVMSEEMTDRERAGEATALLRRAEGRVGRYEFGEELHDEIRAFIERTSP